MKTDLSVEYYHSLDEYVIKLNGLIVSIETSAPLIIDLCRYLTIGLQQSGISEINCLIDQPTATSSGHTISWLEANIGKVSPKDHLTSL